MESIPSVLYCRPDVPAPPVFKAKKLLHPELRLLPSQRDELVKATSPIIAVTQLFHAKTPEQMLELRVPEEWPMALAFAKKNRARIVVYRVEHLAKAKERGVRLRELTDAGVPLYIFKDWPLPPLTLELMRQLADYSDDLYWATERDRVMESGRAIRAAVKNGVLVGRPPRCECSHERAEHDGGVGMCSIGGCPCTAYSKTTEEAVQSPSAPEP